MLTILNSLIDVFFEKNEATLKKQVAKIIALLGHKFSSEPQNFFQVLIDSQHLHLFLKIFI